MFVEGRVNLLNKLLNGLVLIIEKEGKINQWEKFKEIGNNDFYYVVRFVQLYCF